MIECRVQLGLKTVFRKFPRVPVAGDWIDCNEPGVLFTDDTGTRHYRKVIRVIFSLSNNQPIIRTEKG